jgi:hypothetical protein
VSRTALIVVVLVTAWLFLAGCGQQEQGQDTETTEENTAEETTAQETTTEETTTEETTGGETIVEETTRQETTTAASDGEEVAEAEATPPAQAAPSPPSNEEGQPSDGSTPSHELGVNEAGHDVPASNTHAISPANSIVFFRGGNGITYSCTGGPPFVSNHDAMGAMGAMGNCTVQQVGLPPGLICDIPTTITIVHDMYPFVTGASICYSVSGDPSLPSPAQTYSPGPELGPYPPAA